MPNAIEFIDNEQYCRWKGNLMTPENCIALFGLPVEEIHTLDDKTIIIYGDKDYTKLLIEGDSIQDAICIYIKFHSYENVEYSYDNALDEAHGFSKIHKSQKLLVNDQFLNGIKSISLLTEELKSKIKIDLATQYFTDLNKYYVG